MIDQQKTKEQLIEELADLRQREAQWRSVVAGIPVFVALVDRAGTMQYLNHTAPGHSLEETIGKSAYDFLEPAYREIAKECIERVFDTGQSAFFETAGAGAHGDTAWYETYVGPVKVAERVVAVTLVANDITRRKQAEQERDRTQAMLQATIENLPFDFFAIGLDGRYILQNAVSKAHWGCAIGKRPEEFCPTEEDLALWKENNRRAFGGERVEEDVSLFCNGEKRFYNNILTPIRSEGTMYGILGMNFDITERKRAKEVLEEANNELERRVEERTTDLSNANERLRQSNDQLQTIYDGMIEGLLITDIETKRFIRVNASMCRMLGYSEEALLAASIKDIHPPEEVLNDLQRFQAVAEGRVSINEDRPVLRKDGSVFYADITGHRVIYNERPCLLALFRDISERKQAQEALRLSEAKYRQLVETTDTGYLILDEEGRVLDANAEYVRQTGHSMLGEIMGRRVGEWTAPHDAERNAQEVAKCLRTGGVRRLEIDYVGPNGTITPIEINATAIDTKQGRRIILLCRDITERKQAEEALRQSRDKLQAIYDTMVDGLLIADCATGRLLQANPAICRMLGYTQEQLLSMSVADIHPPEVVPSIMEKFRTQKEGQRILTENRPMLRKDGSVFYADIGNVCIMFQGRPCVIGIFRDNTERKLAQEALERERKTLKHLLQSSDHERQLIAYEIHDGLAQQLAGALMQFETFAHMKDKQPEHAEDAFHAGLTMLRQSHFEARRLIAGVRPPILDESGVVAAVSHLAYEEGRHKGPQIEYRSRVDFDRLAPTLENAIYRICQEGLANACQHSQSEKVRVSLSQHGDRVRIEIRDWGIGFNVKAIPKNHFGLEGIRQRVRLLGGKWNIRSLPGNGTRIIVELPVVLRD